MEESLIEIYIKTDLRLPAQFRNDILGSITFLADYYFSLRVNSVVITVWSSQKWNNVEWKLKYIHTLNPLDQHADFLNGLLDIS